MTPALAFYKAPGTIIDKAIRLRTRSPYSHVEFLPYGGALDCEAVAWSSSARDGGVRCKLIGFRRDRWDIMSLNEVPEEALNRCAREDGKLYDYWGVLVGRALGIPVQSRSRWFCSELVAHALGFADPASFSPGRLAQVVLHT